MCKKSSSILLLLLVIFISACTSAPSESTESAVEEYLVLSEAKLSLYIFCNNTDVSCFDLRYIMDYLDTKYGRNELKVGYLPIDTEAGGRIFDELAAAPIPSYVILNQQGNIASRSVDEIDLDDLDTSIESLLSED